MTLPLPFNTEPSFETLRDRWLQRYIRIQARADTKIRTALVEGAEDAYAHLVRLEDNPTFSAGVRTAQIKMVMDVVREVHKGIFGQVFEIIKDGYGKSADAVVDAFADTDRDYLERAFGSTGKTKDFIASQKQSARLGVAHAASRLAHSDKPLSRRVYTTQSLANGWVQRAVTSQIMRGGSAKDIAVSVRRHIRPGVPGGTSYAALRLGRTEINNAFHATTIELTKDRPWVENNQWNLSKTHEPQGCRCETYARTRYYPVDNTPGKPHPQCRCFITPVLEPFESFVTNLKAGYYRDWTDRNAA